MPKLPQIRTHKNYEKFKKIRKATDLKIKPNPFLRDWVQLRYYQVIGVMHLLLLNRMVLGDGTGLGKTLQVIATYCYLRNADSRMKMLIICPKSATSQWVDEFEKFTEGLNVSRLVNMGKQSRVDQYKAFWEDPDQHVLVMHYYFLRADFRLYEPYMEGKRFTLILDEVTAVKTHTSKTHKAAKVVSKDFANRCYGLTATLLKNNLEEGWGIYKVVHPNLFSGITKFRDTYCIQKKVKRGGRNIPIVVGYKNIDHFRRYIDPFFIGRNKYDVSTELPDLITKEVEVGMSDAQWALYGEALGETLTIRDTSTGEEVEKEMTDLTRLAYFQQIVNSPELLGMDGASEKEEEFYRIVQEELSDEKIVVYSKSKKMINILERGLKLRDIPTARITGDENEYQRTVNKLMFQEDMEALKRWAVSHLGKEVDPRIKRSVVRSCRHQIQDLKAKNFPRVILLTPAGTEALNLQRASSFIFFDSPWSPGDYDQLLGRMIRIGSIHEAVLAIHLTCKGTIDDHILVKLRQKKKVISQVLGEQTKGALEFEKDSSVASLMQSIKHDAAAFSRGGKAALMKRRVNERDS
tara:strand:- start:318 stop:2051 length:1734 start_codon:yes stop_codon:yes gene_type:complete